MAACVQHPEFLQPENPETSLWRYMDVSKFEWLISNQRLLMPAADRLGDRWEGTIPQGHTDWWEDAIARAETDEQRATLIHNQGFLSRIAGAFRSHFYVSCWHRNVHENYAMWACYTNSPEAVAVKTNYRALCSELPDYAFLGAVRYVDYSEARRPSMNMFEVIMHKDTYFSFEQEVRAVVLPPASNPVDINDFSSCLFESESDSTFRCLAPQISISALITEIVLHPEAPDEFAERVANLCVEHELPMPVASRRTRELGR